VISDGAVSGMLKAGVLEQHLHQDRIAHAAKRQSESQDGGSLVLELVELSLAVFDPDTTFSVRNTHSATDRFDL
jgi:hypothetical protein